MAAEGSRENGFRVVVDNIGIKPRRSQPDTMPTRSNSMVAPILMFLIHCVKTGLLMSWNQDDPYPICLYFDDIHIHTYLLLHKQTRRRMFRYDTESWK